MVSIIKGTGHIIVEVKGLHKLWAFKSRLIIPAQNIVQAYASVQDAENVSGIRAPGTYIPGIIAAGTYYSSEGRVFMDVVNRHRAITILLRDHRYSKLIVEVQDPAAALSLLNRL